VYFLFVGWLLGWLVGWLVGGLVGWLVGYVVNGWRDILVDGQIERHYLTDSLTNELSAKVLVI
jgi:hypothetical protein